MWYSGHSGQKFILSYLVLTAMVLILCATGCSRLPNNGVPIYLHIDSPMVVYDSRLGSASCQIPDVWAITGAHNLGAYQTPVNIPVLASGSPFFLISAGVYDNGILDTRAQYPFYTSDSFSLYNVVPGQVYHYHPVYRYFTSTQVGSIEDFEGNNNFSNMTRLSKPAYDPDSVVYEGHYGGGIIMNTGDSSISCVQVGGEKITTNGREAYIEMNYKLGINSGIYCDVGLIATTPTGTQNFNGIITLTPTKGYWNKIYLNCNQFAGSNQGSTFQIYFITYRLPGTTDTMFLDNIKLLYFN